MNFNWLTGNISPDTIYKSMSKDVPMIDTSFQKETGQAMFDPNSQYNRGLFQDMRNNSMDQLALQNLLSQRQAAMGQGLGARQRQAAAGAQAGESLASGFTRLLGQQQGIGAGLLGQALQGDSQNQSIKQQWAAAAAQQKAQNAANVAGLWQGGLGMLGGSFFGGKDSPAGTLFGGLLGKMGFGGNNQNTGTTPNTPEEQDYTLDDMIELISGIFNGD